MDETWPFAEPKDTIVMTSQRVIREGVPIRFVTHTIEDGTWLFLDARTIDAADETAVDLGDLALHDQTILDLAQLPLGWHARRSCVEELWIMYPACCW